MRERIKLPMTELEERLKICLSARPDIQSHILTGQELAEYTLDGEGVRAEALPRGPEIHDG